MRLRWTVKFRRGTLHRGSDRGISVTHIASRLDPAGRRAVHRIFVQVARSAGFPVSAEQLRGVSAAFSTKSYAFTSFP